MKNLRMIAVVISAVMLSIAFGCEKEYVQPDPNLLPSMNTSESKIDEEPEYPSQFQEGVPCDSLICCDGFELPKENE